MAFNMSVLSYQVDGSYRAKVLFDLWRIFLEASDRSVHEKPHMDHEEPKLSKLTPTTLSHRAQWPSFMPTLFMFPVCAIFVVGGGGAI